MIVVPSFDTDDRNGFIFGIKAQIHQKSEFRTKVSLALSYFISKNIKCNGINKIGNWRSNIYKDYFESIFGWI